MKCYMCLWMQYQVASRNTIPTNVVQEAVTVYNGEAVCQEHLVQLLDGTGVG